MELTTTKEKILEAANKCNSVKETLKILFPEAFEEEFLYFKTGTMFFIHNTVDNKGYLSAQYITKDSDVHIENRNNVFYTQYATTNKLLLLIHDKNASEYRLVHISTGYRWNSKIYPRTGKGIQIPKDDLRNLSVFAEGEGK